MPSGVYERVIRDPDERFKEKVFVTSCGCWIWLGKPDKDGYGIFFIDGKQVKAHRYSYIKKRGPIKKGLEIDHLCRIRCCVNPGHMEAVTHKKNMSRGKFANSRKTHCPKGHPYSGDNLFINKSNGGRQCKTCMKRNRKRSKK